MRSRYKIIITLLLCLSLAGCGGNGSLALPTRYACVALPNAGAAAVVDLTQGQEKLLGYVKAGARAGVSVACVGGRLYLANQDNGNIYVYDIAEAMANQSRLPLDAPSSLGLKGGVLIDAQISGLAADKQRGRVYVISHTANEGPTFDLLTMAEGTRKLTSMSLPVDVSGEAIMALSTEGTRLYIGTASQRKLTVRVGDNLMVEADEALTATQPYQLNADGTVSQLGDHLAKLNLAGAKYEAAINDTHYVTYDAGLAIVQGDKVIKQIKIAGGPAGVVISEPLANRFVKTNKRMAPLHQQFTTHHQPSALNIQH